MAAALDCSNAFSTAAGSHGCFSAKVRRTPMRCMIGKMPVRL